MRLYSRWASYNFVYHGPLARNSHGFMLTLPCCHLQDYSMDTLEYHHMV